MEVQNTGCKRKVLHQQTRTSCNISIFIIILLNLAEKRMSTSRCNPILKCAMFMFLLFKIEPYFLKDFIDKYAKAVQLS